MDLGPRALNGSNEGGPVEDGEKAVRLAARRGATGDDTVGRAAISRAPVRDRTRAQASALDAVERRGRISTVFLERPQIHAAVSLARQVKVVGET